ncbi:hypothetical protein K443DRAFT_8060 [Laccaria amethystina LaAM-08-1]|uniref:Uncharacterized protein n=1 Tax=Laccaria amethystina LaAM-08-1 TaxID=1095629 RepID=A0A0C9X4B0_9AGAR|nr:hypothetical protein K443DRAFT_8060 [Laccaria amethystina LaAM-08-1]
MELELSQTIPVTHSRDLRLSLLTYTNKPSPTQTTLADNPLPVILADLTSKHLMSTLLQPYTDLTLRRIMRTEDNKHLLFLCLATSLVPHPYLASAQYTQLDPPPYCFIPYHLR